ncbi:SDR family NAD(P)-dependent oxidoreductase [Gammaproteobacteria bacterium]|nr:SDR family NAD(P)-dependent oxidoreductase [Gammaproteobacteria bacterium]
MENLQPNYQTIAIIGSSGAIARALINQLAIQHPEAQIFMFSSQNATSKPSSNQMHHQINYQDEASIAQAAMIASRANPIDLIIVATGQLYDQHMMPEKSLKELSMAQFENQFQANCTLPAMIAKHFLPKMPKNQCALFAALSARVGSISDNRLGGWYSYRASKAALNMFIKTAAIETKRTHPRAAVIGLHPGTVDSSLSKPFQARVAPDKLFTPSFTAAKLIEVISQCTPSQSGKCLAWDGQVILP